MSSINTQKRRVFAAAGHTGNLNEQFMQWLAVKSGVGAQLNQRWLSMIIATVGTTTQKTVTDGWYAWLAVKGFTQSDRNARELAYWTSL
jgi:hypothetical protein